MGAKKEKYARRIEERVRSVEERMDKVERQQTTSDGMAVKATREEKEADNGKDERCPANHI